MKEVQAIVHMTSGDTGNQKRSTYHKLRYVFTALKPGSKQTPCADRVSWIGGALGGHGIAMRNASLMAAALDCGHTHFPGRRTRHVVVSCAPCGDDERKEAEFRLIASAPLLATWLEAERWIAVIHCDTGRPHMHMLIMNFDPVHNRRLEFTPMFLSELQDMGWTPFLASGKGSRMGGRGSRGEIIENIRRERAKEDPVKRNQALDKLYRLASKKNALALKREAFVLWLSEECLVQGWDNTKLLTLKGTARKSPSVRIDGINLRISFFFRFARKRTPKAVEKRRRRRITPPDYPNDIV